ncbi:MAG TPA: hypothetical protein VN461_11565 [Vicinamibacteria bacterium]|nr:hypothetical protein [Vicinamibacteria bacterium]
MLGGVVSPQFLGSRATPTKGKTDIPKAPSPILPTSPVKAEFVSVLARFLTPDLDSAAATLPALRKEAEKQSIDVRFLIATLPDPIDSHAGWLFDPLLDAIQSATAASGYVLDRYSVPWRPTTEVSGGRLHRIGLFNHEEAPAVVLLRRTGPQPSYKQELLVLFLVGETPTSGIHTRALLAALKVIGDWNPDGARTIPILGPSFSGSTASLVSAIRSWGRANHNAKCLRIVSGSATSIVRKRIEEVLPNRVTFRATVAPDTWVLEKMHSYMSDTYGLFEERGPLGKRLAALLVESNTDYGRALSDYLSTQQADALVLRFPLHIAHLRSAYASDRVEAPPETSTSATSLSLRLSFDEPLDAADLLPTFDPLPTSREVDLALSNILDVLGRERVSYVGLLATDSRDKLFLAQQIARHCPDVVLFTLESDLFYAHPDYARYMRGAIVVSSYPVFNGTQSWTLPFEGARMRLQLPTTNTQGVYNATLALLGYDEEGNPLSYSPAPPNLVDYAVPQALDCPDGCRPPLWFSVVGRGSIWPLATAKPSSDVLAYVQPWKPPSHGNLSEVPVALHPSEFALAAFGVLTFIGLAHGLAYCFQRQEKPWPLLSSLGCRGHAERQPYLFVCFGVLSSLYAVCAPVLLIALGLIRPGKLWPAGLGWGKAGLVAVAFCAIGLASCTVWSGLSAAALTWSKKGGHVNVSEEDNRQKGIASGLLLGALLVGCSAAAWFLWYSWAVLQGLFSVDLQTRAALLFYVERATNPGNGVSPLVPLLLLGAAFYAAAFLQLRRLSLPHPVLGADGLPEIKRLAKGAIDGERAALGWLVGPGTLLLPPWRLAVPVLGLIFGAFCLNLRQRLSTIEGPVFDAGCELSFLLLHGLVALSLLRFVCLWSSLKDLLRRLSAHPIVAAYSRLSPRLARTFEARYSPAVPEMLELGEPLGLARRLDDGLGAVKNDLETRYPYCKGPLLVLVTALGGSAATEVMFENEVGEPKAATTWSGSGTWQFLVGLTAPMIDFLDTFWTGHPNVMLATRDSDKPDPPLEWLSRGEEFLATLVALCVREVLAHLRNCLLFVMIGLFLILGVVSSFPFQPQRHLLGFPWVVMLGVIGALVMVFVQIDRDEVISRISGTPPGRVSWDWTFVSSLLTYGLLPLATLFATQFPEIGTVVLTALQPVQKSIP